MGTITKTIQVEICDRCHQEVRWKLEPCPVCKKEICRECMVHFVAQVRKIEPFQRGEVRGSSVSHMQFNFLRSYCADCGMSIERRLLDAGFRKHQAPNENELVLD